MAVVAVVLSLLSLAWQLLAFLLTGPRIRVTITEAFRAADGGVIATSPASIVGGLATLTEMGYTEHVVFVRVENRGRTAATVERWTIRFGNRAVYIHPVADPLNVSVPARLDPHASVTFHTPVKWLAGYELNFTDRTRRAKRIRAEVTVSGLRRDVTSRWSLRVDAKGVHEHGRWLRRRLGRWGRVIRSKLPA